ELGRQGLLFRDLVFRGKAVVTAEGIAESFYSLDPSMAVPNRLRLVAQRLLQRLSERQKEARGEDWAMDAIELLDNETYARIYQNLKRKKQYSGSTFDDHDLEREELIDYVLGESFKPLRSRVKKFAFVNLKATYRQLYADPAFARRFASEVEGGLPEHWEEICAATIARLDKGEMAYEDATPYLYLVERVRGFHTNTSVRHLLIDEAQDYTAFQFAFLKRLFPHSRVTALGDLNQSINAHNAAGSSGFKALSALYDPEDTETITLTRSYRSTRQIVEFTSRCIEGGEVIQPF
ncbi:AAA family ATPase, partial [Paenibacillus sepulcri]|nr:AAA family ATPase [Paenibacillus sepulcri]